jgi:antirestriction protein ArdC
MSAKVRRVPSWSFGSPIASVERIVAEMPNRPSIEHIGTKAFYSSISDRVTMPPRKLFISAEEYSATLLHEIGTVGSVIVSNFGACAMLSTENALSSMAR